MSKKHLDELKKYGRILNEEFKKDQIDPVIGRDQEIRRVVQILSRRKKNNPVLIGEAGVGKTAIVEGLTQRIENQDVPTNLLRKQIFELNLASLISGTKFHGEFEQRLKTITEIIQKNSDVLIFIDELHLIVGAGRTQGVIDASNILKPALARGELRCIGATTTDEYQQFIEKDAALERRFQKILVSEPTVKETITILRGIKNRFESFHEITIKDDALISAANLSNQYISLRNLPDKAIDLVDEACAKIKTEISSVPSELDEVKQKIVQLTIEKNALLKEEQSFSTEQKLKQIDGTLKQLNSLWDTLKTQWEKEKQTLKRLSNAKKELVTKEKQFRSSMQEGNYDYAGELKYQIIPHLKEKLKKLKKEDEIKKTTLLKNSVDKSDIADVVASWTKIPVQRLLSGEKEKILGLHSELKKKVKAQDTALNLISQAVIRSRVGLKETNQPIASFLFVGPTGVGKTLVAKTLTEVLFSDIKKMIAIDMSEYNTRHSVSRLIGSPPGYVGYEKGGQLTEKVKNRPYSVVLLDEIEKAHPEVQALLLQVLEEGHLTDGLGKTIDFRNTIIIMTSNIGGELIETDQYTKKAVLDKVQVELANEFFNRIDEVVVFNPLDQVAVAEIIELELNNFVNQIGKDKHIFFQFDNKVKQKILKENWTINYGARPIRRYIVKHIGSLVAKGIISDQLEEDKLYLLTFDQEKFIIREAVLN